MLSKLKIGKLYRIEFKNKNEHENDISSTHTFTGLGTTICFLKNLRFRMFFFTVSGHREGGVVGVSADVLHECDKLMVAVGSVSE